MAQSIQLNVPEPCHQNWQQMTPQDQGRFCNACAKVVVDFTTMTDKEVLSYFSKATGKTCGRLDQDQLNREIKYSQPPKKSWKKYWLSMAAALILFSSRLTAQTKSPKATTAATPPSCSNKKGEVIATMGLVARPANQIPKTRLVTGLITDNSNAPIVAASIVVKGTGNGVAANENGEFSINIAEGNHLLVSAVGFETKEFKWSSDVNKDSVVRIALTTHLYTGEVGVIVVAKKKKRNLFDVLKKNEQKQANGNQSHPMKIYPNPIAAGGRFNINLAGVLSGNYSIVIYDGSGRIILQKEIDVNKSAAVNESFQCDERFRRGMYIAKISGVSKIYTQQFVVQ
jgi:CarboxypepD_reg-like domain/Secretion system C-terminal sorting domain